MDRLARATMAFTSSFFNTDDSPVEGPARELVGYGENPPRAFVGRTTRRLRSRSYELPSSHRACLRWCGFIEARREHRTVYNRIADRRVLKMLAIAQGLLDDNAEHVAACCRIDDR